MSLSAVSEPIDPRSFHIFEAYGELMLFDRATGTVSNISAELFRLLAFVSTGLSVYEAAKKAGFEETDADETVAYLSDLQNNHGFFRFQSVDLKAQDDMLKSLLEHRPRRIQLLMAQGCNLGCRYCYAWRNGSNQKGTLMTFEMAKASVDFLVRRSGSRVDLQITFFGGEPLLNYSTVKEVVAYAKQLELETNKKFIFEIITNGTLLTPEVVEFLIENRFLLMVSLDGDEEMHSYNRPSIDGTPYEVIVKNVVHANNEYIRRGLWPIKVRANLTSKHRDYQGTATYLRSLGFTRVEIGPIEPLPHGDSSPTAFTDAQMEALQEEAVHRMKESLDKLGTDPKEIDPQTMSLLRTLADPLVPSDLKGVSCGIGRNTTVVDNKGNLYPCHRYEGMEAYRFGNVSTGVEPEKLMSYYRAISTKTTSRCHSCWIRDYCAGGCAWVLSDKNGKIHDPTPQECDRRRKSFAQGLYFRAKLRKIRPDWFAEKFSGAGIEDPLDRWSLPFESAGDGEQ